MSCRIISLSHNLVSDSKRSCGFRLPVEAEAAILCFLIAAITILPVMVKNSGYFALSNDFIAQEIPFGMLMNDAIKSGSIWNWSIDLGGNLLESFSFYNIGSPFFWISLLFPSNAYPKLIGWIFILKFAVAGATSSLWLKRHLSKRECVVMAAVLYTFSGAQCINTVFYHFQDVAAFFPLMMTGLEVLVEDGKYGRFAFACALNMLCNPVFFFASAVFAVLYFCFSYLLPPQKIHMPLRKIAVCIAEGLAGSMLGGITAIPAIMAMIGNPRATSSIPLSEWFTMTFQKYMIRIGAFLLPAESMNAYSYAFTSNWDSWSAYLPLFGMVFVMAYLWKNKDRFRSMILCCFVFVLVPILNSSFNAFSLSSYGRWLFMLDLLLALATAKVVEEFPAYRGSFAKCCAVSFILLIVFSLLLTNQVERSGRFLLNQLVAFGSIGLCYLLSRLKDQCCVRAFSFAALVCCAALFCLSITEYCFSHVDNTNIDFSDGHNDTVKRAVSFLTEIPSELPQETGSYRYLFDEGDRTTLYISDFPSYKNYTYYNYGMTSSLHTTQSFISTCNNSVFELYQNIGVKRKV